MKTLISSRFLLLVTLTFGQENEKKAQLDSIWKLTANSEPDTIRTKAYIDLSVILYVENFDTLLSLNQIAYEIAQENLKKDLSEHDRNSFLGLQADAGGNMGFYYQEIGEYDHAMKYYNEALKIHASHHDYDGISINLNNIGMVYNYRGDALKSLDYFLMSLKIDQARGADLEEIAISVNNIAYIYEHQGDTARALDYYEQALEMYRQTENTVGQAQISINVGAIYRAVWEIDKARNCFNESLKLSYKNGHDRGKASAYLSLGHLMHMEKLYDSSIYYLDSALFFFKKEGDAAGTSISYSNLAKNYFEKGEITLSEQYAKKGHDIAQQIGHPYNIKGTAEVLKKVYKAQGRYKESLDMYELEIQMRDSLQNLETEQEAFQKQLQYQYDREQELSDLKHQQEIKVVSVQKANQEKIIMLVIVILCLVLVSLALIFYRLRKTREQKRLIEKKNQENELLLGEIHHRVKNNLQLVSSLLSLQEKSMDDDAARQAILEGKDRVHAMGLIHKMLYSNDDFSGIEMSSYIEKLVDGLMSTFGLEKEDVEVQMNFDVIKLDVETAIPLGLIINELITNAFKHAYQEVEHAILRIQLEEKNEELKIEVSDNGKGAVNHLDTDKTFGMRLIKSLMRQLRGNWILDDSNGMNYTIFIKDYKRIE